MKRLSLIAMAALLMLGLAQCKKEKPTENNDEGERVNITLNLGSNAKVGIEDHVNTAGVTYDTGDKILVGSNGKYVGQLTFQSGSTFTGSINADYAVEDQPLQFIFVGPQTLDLPAEGETTSFTFSLADQSTAPAVLATAPSNENYPSTTSSYTAHLKNQCALAKFDLGSVNTNATITLSGLTNSLNVAWNGTVTSNNGTGDIITNGTGTTRYAVVAMNQAAVTNGTASATGYEGTFTMSSASTNGYISNATMTLTEVETPSTFQSGIFTINGSGTKVHFSPGNLQYKSDEGWRFAGHQYDYIGTWNTSEWVDLFGWGTWGSGQNPLLNTGYGTSSDYQWVSDFSGTLLNNNETGWRTLSNEEWVYILTNSARGEKRFLKAAISVNNVLYKGIIVFPDNYDGSIGSYVYNNTSSYTLVESNHWPLMESAGAVFLPNAGQRNINDVGSDPQRTGAYWSSTPYYEDGAYGVYCWSTGFYPGGDGNGRYYGYSVRLVKEIEPYTFTVSGDNGATTSKIIFAPGNLLASTTNGGTTWTWSFAEHQWDYVGDAVANTAVTGNGTVSSNGTVDLFGWSTNSTYFGIHNSVDNSEYSGEFVDWGRNVIYNPKTNTNDNANTWRTLTWMEWIYLKDHNTKGWSTVAGKNGLVIRPDGVTTPVASSYTAETWANEEANGSVFLPAAGRHWRVESFVYLVGDMSTYWSSTPKDADNAYNFSYYDSSCSVWFHERCNAYSVRLVHDTN